MDSSSPGYPTTLPISAIIQQCCSNYTWIALLFSVQLLTKSTHNARYTKIISNSKRNCIKQHVK